MHFFEKSNKNNKPFQLVTASTAHLIPPRQAVLNWQE
jgi:hypothetical protein